MGIKRIAFATLVCAALASPLQAQFGGAVGVRSVSGDESDAANSDRRGLEMRAFWEGALRPTLRWRAELAFSQMQYQRDIGIDVRQVSENGVELSALASAEAANGALAGTYIVAGPLASARLNCGASGGFVDCDEGPAQRIGYVVGVGYRTAITPRRDLLFEVRYLGNPVSGAGGDILALTIGLQLARR